MVSVCSQPGHQLLAPDAILMAPIFSAGMLTRALLAHTKSPPVSPHVVAANPIPHGRSAKSAMVVPNEGTIARSVLDRRAVSMVSRYE